MMKITCPYCRTEYVFNEDDPNCPQCGGAGSAPIEEQPVVVNKQLIIKPLVKEDYFEVHTNPTFVKGDNRFWTFLIMFGGLLTCIFFIGVMIVAIVEHGTLTPSWIRETIIMIWNTFISWMGM